VCTFQVEALAAIGAAAAVPSKQSEARKRLLKLMQVEDSVVRCAEYSSCGHSPPIPTHPPSPCGHSPASACCACSGAHVGSDIASEVLAGKAKVHLWPTYP
jgi:hypothetical protein